MNSDDLSVILWALSQMIRSPHVVRCPHSDAKEALCRGHELGMSGYFVKASVKYIRNFQNGV